MSGASGANSAAPERQTGAARSAALAWTVLALTIAACIVLTPLIAPIILAAWVALIAWPLQQRAIRLLRRPAIASGVLTALLVIALLLPIAITVLSLSSAALELAPRVQQSKNLAEALKTLSAGSGAGLDLAHFDLQHALDLVRQHGARALGASRAVFGALTAALLGVVVFVAAFYCLLIDGERARDWLIDRFPLARGHTQRLANVFAEVGRGMLIGIGLTALLQGALAAVGYLVTGVPQALVLGLITAFAALIPSVGAALVWLPVSIGLFASGRTSAALGMLVIGGFVSIADNLVRPLLARQAKLRLPPMVLFVAMLGGIAVLGAWGLLFGPLLVRLAGEGLTIMKEEREARGD